MSIRAYVDTNPVAAIHKVWELVSIEVWNEYYIQYDVYIHDDLLGYTEAQLADELEE